MKKLVLGLSVLGSMFLSAQAMAAGCSSFYIIDKSNTCGSNTCQTNPKVQVISAVDYSANPQLGNARSCVTCEGVAGDAYRTCMADNEDTITRLLDAYKRQYPAYYGLGGSSFVLPSQEAFFWINNADSALRLIQTVKIRNSKEKIQQIADPAELTRMLKELKSYSLGDNTYNNIYLFMNLMTVEQRAGLRKYLLGYEGGFGEFDPVSYGHLFFTFGKEIEPTPEFMDMLLKGMLYKTRLGYGPLRYAHLYMKYSYLNLRGDQENLQKLIKLSNDFQGMVNRNELKGELQAVVKGAQLDVETERTLNTLLDVSNNSQTDLARGLESLIEIKSKQYQRKLKDIEGNLQKLLDICAPNSVLHMLAGYTAIRNLDGVRLQQSLLKGYPLTNDPNNALEFGYVYDDLAFELSQSLSRINGIIESFEKIESNADLDKFSSQLLDATSSRALAMNSEAIMELAISAGDKIGQSQAMQRMVLGALLDQYKEIFTSFEMNYREVEAQVITMSVSAKNKRSSVYRPKGIANTFNPKTLDPDTATLQRLNGVPSTGSPGAGGNGNGSRRTSGR